MRDFQRGRRNDSRGGGDFRRRDYDRPQEMFRTICSNCGKDCEVPFKPTGEKPVYCRECFQKMGGNGRDDRGPRRDNFSRRPEFERRDDRKSEHSSNDQFVALNSKLDRIIDLLTPKQVPVGKAIEVETPVETLAEVPVKAKAKPKKKKVVAVPEETPQE